MASSTGQVSNLFFCAVFIAWQWKQRIGSQTAWVLKNDNGRNTMKGGSQETKGQKSTGGGRTGYGKREIVTPLSLKVRWRETKRSESLWRRIDSFVHPSMGSHSMLFSIKNANLESFVCPFWSFTSLALIWGVSVPWYWTKPVEDPNLDKQRTEQVFSIEKNQEP